MHTTPNLSDHYSFNSKGTEVVPIQHMSVLTDADVGTAAVLASLADSNDPDACIKDEKVQGADQPMR